MSYVSSPQDQVRALSERLFWMTALICVIAALLLGRLWGLQVFYGDHYLQLSEQNRLRHVPIQAPRGRIYDRDGRLIVTNTPSLNLYLVREDMTDADATMAEISRVLGWPVDEIQARFSSQRRAPFLPVLIKQGLSLTEAARLEAHRLSLPGMKIEVEARRHYLYESLAAHLLGYVGEISAEQLERDAGRDLVPGMVVGQTGVERTFDPWLHGRPGVKRIEVDALGHERQVVEAAEPRQGDDLYLTIDLAVQQRAEEALGGRAGAVVAIDPRTGEVLAMVSHPAVDANRLAGSLSAAEWNRLATDGSHPLTNRAIQGVYPPGSIFKIPVAAAVLESGQMRPEERVFCQGGLLFGRRLYRDWKAGGHGSMSLTEALVNSCDVYFYKVGSAMGIDLIAQYAAEFGLGQPTGIGLPSERRGVVPSTAWKAKAIGEPWYPGETLSASIGQSYLGATPLQMASMMATVASRGARYQPQLVRAMRHRETGRLVVFPPVRLADANVGAKTFEVLHRALAGVVQDQGGTGSAAKSKFVSISGKTGTAQVVSSPSGGQARAPENFQDHAWFVAFAPIESPTIAVAVLVEHGGKGGAVAAPVAKQVIEAYVGAPPAPAPSVVTDVPAQPAARPAPVAG
ncbi:MAG: penicillin-binding protein 2 [Nitrospirota bacterium]